MAETNQLPPETEQQASPAPQRYAVVVGINDYKAASIPDLSFCTNDAEAFYDALLSYAGYDKANTALFSDGSHPDKKIPTYSDILSSIQRFCSLATEEDSILFFFAGHGTKDAHDSYLLTNEYRSNVLSDSSMSMAKINRYLEESKAKFKMRFFDACHSGRIGRRNGLPNPDVATHLQVQAEGWATLAACKEDEYAHELDDLGHGIFSLFLIKGLQGEASNDNNTVTLDNLKVYVMDNVIELTRKRGITQTPVFAGEQAGNLTLALVATQVTQELPTSLQQIAQVRTRDLVPEGDDASRLLGELKGMLERDNDSESADYIARSQEEKRQLVEQTAQQALAWAQEQAQKMNDALGAPGVFGAELIDLDHAPLNLSLAGDLFSLRRNLECPIETRTITKYRKEARPLNAVQRNLLGVMRFGYGRYDRQLGEMQYVDVPYEEEVPILIQQGEHSSTATLLKFTPHGHWMPRCALVVAIVPSIIGFYSYCYLSSTNLAEGMVEDWNEKSFSKKFFFIHRVNQEGLPQIRKNLEEALAQFVSFIIESGRVRQANFEKMGVPARRLKEPQHKALPEDK